MFYGMSTTGYTTRVSEVVKASLDVVLLPDFEGKAGLIMKKASEMGVKATFLGTDLWDPANLVKVAGDAVWEATLRLISRPMIPTRKYRSLFLSTKVNMGRSRDNWQCLARMRYRWLLRPSSKPAPMTPRI